MTISSRALYVAPGKLGRRSASCSTSPFPPTCSLVMVTSAVRDPAPERLPRKDCGKALRSPVALSRKIVNRTLETTTPSSGCRRPGERHLGLTKSLEGRVECSACQLGLGQIGILPTEVAPRVAHPQTAFLTEEP